MAKGTRATPAEIESEKDDEKEPEGPALAEVDGTQVPSWNRGVDTVSRVVSDRRLLFSMIVFFSCLALFLSNRSHGNGGDSRGISDLSWWIAQGNPPRLNGLYPPEPEWHGYWAKRLDTGLIALIPAPGTALVGAPVMAMLTWTGMPSDVELAPILAKMTASILMALVCVCIFLTAERVSDGASALVVTALAAAASPYLSLLSQTFWSQTGAVVCQALSAALLIPLLGRHDQQLKEGLGARVLWGGLLLAAGFLAGFSTCCRPTFIAWAGILGIFLVIKLRGNALPGIVGIVLGLLFTFWVNKFSQGSYTGLHVDKSVNEIGFKLSPLIILKNFLAFTVSPYRGLIFWSPWTLAFIAGLVVLLRRENWRSYWLQAHALFLLSCVAGLLAFSDLWSWEAGPRHPADMIFSGCIIAAPIFAWLLRSVWGKWLVVVCSLPAFYVYHNAAKDPHYRGSYNPVAWYSRNKVVESPMTWKYSTYRYYFTDGEAERDMRDETRVPLLANPQLDLATPEIWAHIQKGLYPSQRVLIQHMDEAVFLFQLPAPPQSDYVIQMRIIDPPHRLSPVPKDVSISVNGVRLHREQWLGGGTRSFVVRVPSRVMLGTGPNRLEVRDGNTRLGPFGPLHIHWEYLRIFPGNAPPAGGG